MASLFISYARADVDVAKSLADTLQSQGHQVWWDRRLSGGAEYSREIEKVLDSADKVIVLWSSSAVESSWVRDEAAAARDSRKLVPLTIDGSPPPLGFRQFHTISLSDWAAAPSRPLPDEFVEALGGVAPAGESGERQFPGQRIAFCRTPDGVTLAYSQAGEGPPLVKAANWLNHLEHEYENPIWRPWIGLLSSRHRLLRYDERGNGMSDWKIPPLKFEQLVDDLTSVVDAAGLDRFDLVAISQGSPVAIAFAVRHPQRVRRLVLSNRFAAGWRHARDPEFVESWEAMATLARTGWGKSSSTFRHIFTNHFFPDAAGEQAEWWDELQKQSANVANASRFLRLFGEIDVSALLPQVSVPTMVMHCRDDQLVPFDSGRMMASRIPGAEFVPLDSRNHLPLATDPAWPKLKRELRRFLDVGE